mgnify:CR=1 FL=1
MQIKKVLISLAKTDNSPYKELEKKYGVQVEYKEFYKVVPVPILNLRKIRFDFNNYSAVIFNSKTAIDHFFRVATEMRYTVPGTMKYFCLNDTISNYLSKYIVYRKRKIFPCDGNMDNFIEMIAQNTDEHFLLPVSDTRKNTLITKLKRKKVNITPAIFYTLEYSDLTDINVEDFDIITLFAPASVLSLKNSFENLKNDTIIATFGKDTAKEAQKADFKVKIKAPSPDCPSMVMAIEKFIANAKK